MDSLAGFNSGAAIIEAREHSITEPEVHNFVKLRENDFIRRRFDLVPAALPAVKIGGGNSVANAPCLNEGFEGLPVGGISAASGWTAYASPIAFPGPLCGSVISNLSNATSLVAATPIVDASVGNVANSPFGGANVIKLNVGSPGTNTRIRQNFLVTTSNFIYQYAYKGYSNGLGHSCCDAPALIFNFFDCSGNPIAALSESIVPSVNNLCSSLPASWSIVGGSAYTPNWDVVTKNFAPYIGSCVTVEVIAANCSGATHYGFCYYDAHCADIGLVADGNALVVNSYTSCASNATLSAVPGFSNFLWQGPANSGVSGSTASLVTTGVSGTYTLTAGIGTVVNTQTMNLVVNGASPVTIAGSNSLCAGSTVSLQAQGNGLTSYTWSTNSNNTSVTVNPSVTTVYTVSATNALGCVSSDTETVTVLPAPAISISASSPTACSGQSVSLSASAPAAVSYTWGLTSPSSTSSVVVSPVVTTMYSVSVTSAAGCTAIATTSISVFQKPAFTVSASSSSICLGQSVTLSASSYPGSYSWSTGSSAQVVTVSPAFSTIYSATLTSNSTGCSSTQTVAVLVYVAPQIQIAASNPVSCSGATLTLTANASANSTILWNTGATNLSIIVSPTVSSVYTATVTNLSNCTASTSVAITVNALPSLLVSASQSVICSGESAVITASGSPGVSYQWSQGSGTSSISVSPLLTTLYTATVTDNNGCSTSLGQNVQVFACTGIETHVSNPASSLLVFPNPTEDAFTIRSAQPERGTIVNGLGQVVAAFNLSAANNFSQGFSGFAAGAYVIRTATAAMKIIVK